MLAAEVWHWWIGVFLTLGGILLVAVMVGLYLKTITARKYPSLKQRRQESDL